MNKTKLILFAFMGWIWCSAIMGLGQLWIPIQILLILHAILGPFGFMLLSWIYYQKHDAPKPIILALIWTLFIIIMDALVVALLIMKSFEMFQSPIGTWIPFTLIFVSVWITGNFKIKLDS